jgi:N6-L-threonylcarbamoyladenine synthase
MIILGIDTSCDDTSLALVRDKREILANVVSSQADLHRFFGGVVPEIASRSHVELIDAIYLDVMKRAAMTPADLDAISVTNGPGLIGSVLVGLSFAKGLSLSLKKPLVAVNHVEAHVMSIFLERDVEFPFVALVVSGGHTIILLMEAFGTYRVLGTTRDDAAGETFDKVAKYLGLGYPGGKVIEEYARQGRKDYVAFPRPMLNENNYDFSFSGLKTSMINYIKNNTVTDEHKMDIIASFQEAAFDVLIQKVLMAAEEYGIARIVVGGGVAANQRLREMLIAAGIKAGREVMFSDPQLCTDNGAMVAATGSYYLERGWIAPLDVSVFSRMQMC